ncbi:hypothetical protein C8J56DRAFT_862500 [Mycena floridula]|nr:hypothetical protein C8J56DRAFT_862500 [Mycena floridula]
MIPLQSYLTWAIILTIFHICAIGTTVFRILCRRRDKLLWWDDFVAGFAGCVDCLYFVVLWIRYRLGTPQHTIQTRVILYWISSLSFFIIVWTSRISLALTLTRLMPPASRARVVTKCMAVAYAILLIALVLQLGIVCGGNDQWHKSPAVACSGTSWASSLTADVIADVTLIVVPRLLLWRVNLAKAQHRLVYLVFATSILTCLASIVLHTFLLGSAKWGGGAPKLVQFLSAVEATIALCVANLLVVAGYIFRGMKSDVDLDEKTQVGTNVEYVKEESSEK